MDYTSVIGLALTFMANFAIVGYTIISSKIQIKYLQDQVKSLELDLRGMRALDADIKVLQTKVDILHVCLQDIKKALERKYEIHSLRDDSANPLQS